MLVYKYNKKSKVIRTGVLYIFVPILQVHMTSSTNNMYQQHVSSFTYLYLPMADTAVTWVLYTESQRVALPLYLLHANRVCQPRSDMTVTTWAHCGSLVEEKGGVAGVVAGVVAPMVKRTEQQRVSTRPNPTGHSWQAPPQARTLLSMVLLASCAPRPMPTNSNRPMKNKDAANIFNPFVLSLLTVTTPKILTMNIMMPQIIVKMSGPANPGKKGGKEQGKKTKKKKNKETEKKEISVCNTLSPTQKRTLQQKTAQQQQTSSTDEHVPKSLAPLN